MPADAPSSLINADSMVVITSINENAGEVYLALFNIADDPAPKEITVDLKDLRITGECRAKDLPKGHREVFGHIPPENPHTKGKGKLKKYYNYEERG
jgi:hypothetical protein